MGYKVAVIGATGNVGREMLTTLAERKFPRRRGGGPGVREIGRQAGFVRRGQDLNVQDLAKFDFRGWDIALSSPGGKVSAEYSPKRGCRPAAS